jgi:hypothetical protein
MHSRAPGLRRGALEELPDATELGPFVGAGYASTAGGTGNAPCVVQAIIAGV